MIISAISVLALLFLGRFFVAICKEQSRTKVCMLLKQSVADTGSEACSDAEERVPAPLHEAAAVITMPRRSVGKFFKASNHKVYLKVG